MIRKIRIIHSKLITIIIKNKLYEIDTVEISGKLEHLKSQSLINIVQSLVKGSVIYNVNLTSVNSNRQLL
jgi:hypothetical protein